MGVNPINRTALGRKLTVFLLQHPKAASFVQKAYRVKLKLPKGYRKITKQ